MNVRDLLLRIRALLRPRGAERELDEELAFHVERDVQKHLAKGLSPADARARALARFGSVPLAADQCRDARGTGFVDDLTRDIFYAFRTFRRAPLAALTIVATVGLGLGMVCVVFTVYNTIYLRTDAVSNPGELFVVERVPGADASKRIWIPFTQREYDALRRETGVFTDAVAMVRSVRTRIEGRRVTSSLVSGNFFHVLGVQPVLGRPLIPADDEGSSGKPVIVLSHRGWSKLFPGDSTVIGRSVRVNGRPYEIVGVMPEEFRGLGILAPDYWAPLALLSQFREADAGKEREGAVEVVGRLKPGTSPEAAAAALAIWASAHVDLRTIPGGRLSVRLRPSQGNIVADVESLLVFSPIFFAFGLILMIGCANVANLLLARGVSRQREIGTRLSLGASRQRIIRQLLTESVLLGLAAAAVGLAVSRFTLASAINAVTSLLPSTLLEVDFTRWTPVADWRVFAFLAVGAIVSTAFFGLAPALQTTRLDLVRTMRGELANARPARARHGLIVAQVGASALLLICSVVFLRGAFAASSVDPGVRTSDTITVAIPNEARRAALLQALAAHASVAAVAASSQPTFVVATTSDSAGTNPSQRLALDRMAVSPEYFDVLGIDLVRGRSFTQAERGLESGVAIVTETAARELWPGRDAVGQIVRFEATQADLRGTSSVASAEAGSTRGEPSRAYTIVGLVRDVGGGLRVPDLFRFRGVYVPAAPERPGTSLTLRVRGDPERARATLLDELTIVDPGLGTINTMRAIAGMQMYIMRIFFWVTVVLSGLALLLTLSGLFSVLSYVVAHRAKEIGVRMTLGATTGSVARLVLSHTSRSVGIGLVVGGGLAAALAIVLMATPAAEELGGLVRVFDPVAYVAGTLIIAAACLVAASVPTLRAARIDPIATLRED
jgi:predicted permease